MMMKSVFWWRKPEYPEEIELISASAIHGGAIRDMICRIHTADFIMYTYRGDATLTMALYGAL